MNDILAALEMIARDMPKTKRQKLFIPIADALTVLRGIRKLGFVVKRDPEWIYVDGRRRKRSTWLIFDGRKFVTEILIDRTNSLRRGYITVLDASTELEKMKLKVDSLDPPIELWGTSPRLWFTR